MPKQKTTIKRVLDSDEIALMKGTKVIAFSSMAERDPKYTFPKPIEIRSPKKRSAMAANLQAGGTNEISVSRSVTLVKFMNPPYSDSELQRFENCLRKSHAVKLSILLRKHMIKGKGSELQIVLPNSEIETLSKEEQANKIKKLKQDNADLLERLERRDVKLKLNKKLDTFITQCYGFGRNAIIKLYKNPEEPKESEIVKLQTINSRRLLFPIIDIDNNNSFEGVIVDTQGLSKDSMIYGTYNNDELSPYTEEYGYSEIEPIAHVAETIWILTNEDLKEIAKSAWLDSILATINTTGLDNTTANTKISNIVKAIAKAGKIVGVNEEVVLQAVSRTPNFDGLINALNKLELMIFNTMQVPEFMVQSEAAANRATAITSATQFLNGVIADDQQWLEDILQDQWYDPFLMENLSELKSENDSEDNSTDTDVEEEKKELPFHVRRVFNQAKASEFVDLAASVVALKNAGIWDLQKANEILDSEEVTQRIMESQKNQPEIPSPAMRNQKETQQEEKIDTSESSQEDQQENP